MKIPWVIKNGLIDVLSTVAQNVFAFERYLFAAAYTNFNNFVKYLRE